MTYAGVEHVKHINITVKESLDMEKFDLKDDILDQRFTETEVTTGINKLKQGKACGVDSISNSILKASKLLIVPFLTKLFNNI